MSASADTHTWLGIELRHLAALHAVCEEQSFVRAGRRLGYTQSAISNQIAALERLVGARLVERARGGSSIALTEAGAILYEHAAALMGRLHAARADIAASTSRPAPVLRLGYCRSVGTGLLGSLARALAARAPGCRLELEPGAATQLLHDVDQGLLDAALVPEPDSLGRPIETTHLLDDHFVLVSPPGEPSSAAHGDPARPLLACAPCPAQRAVEAGLGLAEGAIVRLEDAQAIQALVAAGCASGLLPSLAVTAAGLTVLEVDGPRLRLQLAWHRDRGGRDEVRHLVAAGECAVAELRTRRAA